MNSTTPRSARRAEPRGEPVQHHLVSKGYQKNFADERQRLTILDPRTGKVIDRLRPTKRNWVEADWNTFWSTSGDPNRHLEREFAKIEAGMLRSIREVDTAVVGDRYGAAIVNLAAMHLVRSRSFLNFRRHVYNASIASIVESTAARPELVDRFMDDHDGRRPGPGEIDEIVRDQAGLIAGSRRGEIDTVIDHHNKIAELLADLKIQVVELDQHLPGLPIGDHPIVHADLNARRSGFRDHLAIGQAGIVLIPLTRRTLACLTAEQQPNTVINTISQWRRLVNVQVNAAVTEIATHPDDAHDVAGVCRRPPKRPARRTSTGVAL